MFHAKFSGKPNIFLFIVFSNGYQASLKSALAGKNINY